MYKDKLVTYEFCHPAADIAGYALQAEIKGRDKALLKEIAALDEDVTDQVLKWEHALS